MRTAQPDLFAQIHPPCGECPNLGAAIDSGIRYCHGEMTWRSPEERVEGCVYRGRVVARHAPPPGGRIAAINYLLTDPKHDIDEKARRWLRAELRREQRSTPPGGTSRDT